MMKEIQIKVKYRIKAASPVIIQLLNKATLTINNIKLKKRVNSMLFY